MRQDLLKDFPLDVAARDEVQVPEDAIDMQVMFLVLLVPLWLRDHQSTFPRGLTYLPETNNYTSHLLHIYMCVSALIPLNQPFHLLFSSLYQIQT